MLHASHSINYLLVIGSPDSTGDLAFQVDLRGPVSLPADGPHQDKTITVGDESLSAIVGPSEVTHLKRKQMREWENVTAALFHVCVYVHIIACVRNISQLIGTLCILPVPHGH